MKRNSIWITIVLITAIIGLGYGVRQYKLNSRESNGPRIVVGWQTAWATAGQIVETLDHTNIPQLYGSKATFRNFLFGPDMIEAAVTGNIDVTTTGIVPAINLLAVRDDWVVVCRLIDFPVMMVARSGTGIENIAGLKGRRVGVPFGGGSHPYVLQRLEENNLKVGTGPDAVELVNVTPAEAVTVMQQGGVDAIATWEPQVTIIQSKGLGRTIDEQRLTGFVTVRESLAEKHPDQVVALIKSIITANLYVARNREQSDEWFATRSNFDRELLKKIRVIEPNLEATSLNSISVKINPEDITLTQQVADKMHANGLIKRPIVFKDHVNLGFEVTARTELERNHSTEPPIEILK